MKWSIYICLIISLLLSTESSSQVLIQPTFQQTEVFSIDQLLQVSLVNSSSQAVEGALDISIESGGQMVFRLASPVMRLGVGEMRLADEINWNSRLQYGQNDLASFLRQTGKVYGNNLVFCYHFIENNTTKVLGSSCQEKTLLRFDPPELIFPEDRAKVQSLSPLLTWKPVNVLSFSPISYQLVLTELKKGQSPVEAIRTNFSLINERNLYQPFLPYPSNAQLLEEDKEYAWQVIAYLEGVEIGKTEAWRFSFKPNQKNIEEIPEEGYRFVKRKSDGSYYLANKVLHFAYDNRDNEENLTYQIYPMAKDNLKAMKRVPSITLKPGVNNIDLDLSEVRGMKDSEEYLMTIQTAKNGRYYLRFKYFKKVAQ